MEEEKECRKGNGRQRRRKEGEEDGEDKNDANHVLATVISSLIGKCSKLDQ